MSDPNLDFTVPERIPDRLPVLPLRRGVLLPGAVAPFAVGRPKSRAAVDAAPAGLLLVAVQREAGDDPVPSDLLPIAVLARIVQVQPARGGAVGVVLQGLARARLGAFDGIRPFLSAEAEILRESWPTGPEATVLAEKLRRSVKEAETLHGEPRITAALQSVDDPGRLVDVVASLLEADDAWRQQLLVTLDPVARAEAVLEQYLKIRTLADARRSVEERMQKDGQDLQREALLRRQLKAIQTELGEGEDDEVKRLQKRLAEKKLPEAVHEAVARELKRLVRLQNIGPERSVAIDWLEWVADLPWQEYAETGVDLDKLEATLDASHHGLGDVKRQVIEHLAVKKLGGQGRADVLLLVGPPGVGKTSIGQAIAEATGRELVRVALGGVRDESELRGHRRTYVGARPGRLIEGLRRAKTADPVVLLDEVDKLGRGWQGDPGAALLEILDPEQNHAFTDHYMEVPFDLSRVLFIATANDVSAVPGPLRDRMEMLEIEGYTADDKKIIARRHLFSKLAKNAGVSEDDVSIDDDALDAVIARWTREAGVRQLQRVLAKLFRAVAVKKARARFEGPLAVTTAELDELLGKPKYEDEAHDDRQLTGVATGLAWTPTGGDVLYVEASTKPGSGRLTLTGQLGEVMRESAEAALTYVLSHTDVLGIPIEAYKDRDVHIHVPAGAVPKDGPSAGVTMFTALASLLTQRPIRSDVAMTGEATLRGRVLPVGGIRSKVLAAHRKGLKRVILPRRNERDLADLPAQAREELEFVLVDEMSEVIEHALLAPIRSDGPVRAVDTTEDATLVEPIGGWTGLEPSPGGTAHGGDA